MSCAPKHATGEHSEDGQRYIENFPEEYRAGATWGNCKPLYEYIEDERKREGGSRWGPFEDEDEWHLAEWLIQNVGQKQTDNFLKLPIVSFFLCYSCKYLYILMVNRLKNVPNPVLRITRIS